MKNITLTILVAFVVLAVAIGVGLLFCKQEVDAYTVVFQDYDGAILKTEAVRAGTSAAAPEEPKRDGHIFAGWDKDYGHVSHDLTITAEYIRITDTTLMVENVSTQPGAENVMLKVSVRGNPGILGMLLSVSYDDKVLSLVDYSNGVALSALAFQGPSRLANGCNFIWYGSEVGGIMDGEVLNLVFNIADDAPVGTYPISIAYSDGDIYDINCDMIEPEVISGGIIISDREG